MMLRRMPDRASRIQQEPRAAGLPLHILRRRATGQEPEVEKVALQPSRRFRCRLIEEDPTKFISRPENLPQPRPVPSLVRGGEIEQFECTVERLEEPLRLVSLPGADRAIDLAADIRKLFRKIEATPSSAGK